MQDKNSGHTSDALTGDKKTCMLHGAGNSFEECKVIKIYSESYAAQQPHQNKESRSGGKPKCGKSIEFNENTQEVHVMEKHDDPIRRNEKEKNWLLKSTRLKA